MTQLGKYQLHEELGHGGYGTVHRAYDTVLEVERAVKVLKPELAADKDFIERFKREAKLAAQIDHPRIVPAYDLEEDQGYYFLAMKFMPGKSLKDLLAQKGNLSFDRALEIIQQIAEALDYLHDQNYVHRDVKPGNILFDKDGNAHLSDLGFAKALLGTSGTSQTTTGAMIGTPSYMAPELWREKGVSSATDVYSLGCVFYEMITGKVLFEGETSASIMAKHVMDGPKFGSQWSPDVPAGVKRVLRKALAKKPSKRYEKPSRFYQALKALKHKDNGRKIPIWVWVIGGALLIFGLLFGMRSLEKAQQAPTPTEVKIFIGQVGELENPTTTVTHTPTFSVTITPMLSATNTPVLANTYIPTPTKTQTNTHLPTATSTASPMPDDYSRYPNMIGADVNYAKEALEDQNIEYELKYVSTNSNDEIGKIINQDPESGTPIQVDTTLILEVGYIVVFIENNFLAGGSCYHHVIRLDRGRYQIGNNLDIELANIEITFSTLWGEKIKSAKGYHYKDNVLESGYTYSYYTGPWFWVEINESNSYDVSVCHIPGSGFRGFGGSYNLAVIQYEAYR